MRTPLKYRNILLREFVTNDVGAVAAMFSDARMNWPRQALLGQTTAEQAGKYVNIACEGRVTSPRHSYMLAIESGGAFMGAVTLGLLKRTGAYDIGTLIDPNFRRQGIGLKAKALLLQEAMRSGIDDFSALVVPANVAALGGIVKLGFSEAEHIPAGTTTFIDYNGKPSSVIVFRANRGSALPAVTNILAL